MSFSYKTRKENLDLFANKTFDLVVIGGGISGAGVARDAASRGMSVALIEAQDFAFGTSSRSSKLIHGGIRYLENLEFGLVFEALTERRNLFEIAPHLVHPLRFMLPVYEGDRVGMFRLGLGMWVYDALSLFEAPELHERQNPKQTLSRIPMLNPDHLNGSYVYSDAYMDDDRLVIETLRSACRFGAKAANYVRAIGAKFNGDQICAVRCRDEFSKNEFEIQGHHFVSTVGPWTDQVANQFFSNWRKIMRPSKGVHLTFPRNRLPIQEAVVMVSEDQKRIVFAIPRHEMVIVGTTDTDYTGDPANVHTEIEDVNYILKVADHYFPGAMLKISDIMASYSGVRPLVDDGSESESKTSREHLILADPRNITFVTGGKYTTYRQIAEDAMKVVLNNFELEEQMRWSRAQTLVPLNPLATNEKLVQARGQVEHWAQEFGASVDTVNFLVERHGEEAFYILKSYSSKVQTSPEGLQKWQYEALHSIKETMCHDLRDFYLRRAPLFLARPDHGFLLLQNLADLFGNEFGWNADQRAQAIDAVRKHLEFEMGWRK